MPSAAEFRNAGDYWAYIAAQKTLLTRTAADNGARALTVGITFKRPVSPEELDALVTERNLHITFFEFEGDNNVRGAFSTLVIKNLAEAQAFMQSIDPNANLRGVTYVIVSGKANDLAAIQQDDRVLLADPGPVGQMDNLLSQGTPFSFVPPPSLYLIYKALAP